jgi:hypothetical protein
VFERVNDAVLARLAASGAQPIGARPAEAAAHIRAERARRDRVLKAAGVQPNWRFLWYSCARKISISECQTLLLPPKAASSGSRFPPLIIMPGAGSDSLRNCNHFQEME